jgi:DNA replication protein DnaC
MITPPSRSTQTNSLKRSCNLCDGTGWIIDKENNAVPCKCRKERILNNRKYFANIPEAYKDLRLSTFSKGYYKDKATIEAIEKTVKYYLDNLHEMINEGVGMYFYSETKGSGKTRLVASIANELIYEYDLNVRFATSLEIITEIKATWDKDTEFGSESKLLQYLNSADVLVIDDFGTEIHKDWLDERFYQIINTRYINNRITFFTSNKSLETLDYDSRITNRIKEKSYLIHFPEESIRNGLAYARQMKMEKEIRNEN